MVPVENLMYVVLKIELDQPHIYLLYYLSGLSVCIISDLLYAFLIFLYFTNHLQNIGNKEYTSLTLSGG